MESKLEGNDKIIRYLLEDLPEEERLLVEEEYFTDDAAFERFLALKDELVDAYARDELAGPRRERFEKYFLATGPRRERAREAKELIEFTSRVAATETITPAALRVRGASLWPSFLTLPGWRSPVFQFALAALLLLVVLGGIWLYTRRMGNRQPELVTVTPTPSPEVVSEHQPDGKTQSTPVERPAENVEIPPTPLPQRAQIPDPATKKTAPSAQAKTHTAAGVRFAVSRRSTASVEADDKFTTS